MRLPLADKSSALRLNNGKHVILVFMQEEALKKFRASSGWEAGVDGSVALITFGAGGSLDTTKLKK
jgi:lipid-binding SYLF domain-containing protein